MPFEQFPYTNFHELNQDWIIQKMKELENKFDELDPPYTEYYGKIVNVIEEGVKTDGTNQSGKIQNIINDNPNKVIYFPDGEYVLDEPIMTSASADKRVVLLLSEYATLKASDVFPAADFMVQIGSLDTYDYNNGIPLGIIGGIINCNFRASGIKVEHCSMACIKNMVLRNVAYTGIQVDRSSNSNVSSDAQIENIIVYGQLYNATNIGLLLNGYDNNVNTFRTMHTGKGVVLNGGGNTIIDAHPLCSGDSTFADYGNTVGFDLIGSDNKLIDCYSDQYATGFKFYNSGKRNIIQNGFSMWYQSTAGKRHFAFDGNMNGNTVDGFTVSVPANGTNGIYAPANVSYGDIYPIVNEQYLAAKIQNINISNPENMYYKLNDYGLLSEKSFQIRSGTNMASGNWLPVGIFLMDNTAYVQCEANVIFGWDTIIDVIFNKNGVNAVKIKYRTNTTRTVRAMLTDVDTPFGNLPCRILWISPNFATNISTNTKLNNGISRLLSPMSWVGTYDTLFNLSTTEPSNRIGNIITSD